ncbi:MAG: type-F conjugative transfer system pilin assembly protein TrbC [Nitrospirota bacterium]
MTAAFCKVGLALWASVFIGPSSALAADRLYYFWSFSMPEASLKAALADGEKVGLVAVLRGLPEGSAKMSLGRLKRLLGNHQTEVLIEPRLFTLYGITAVPTLVYAEGVDPSCEICGLPPRHAIVTGDVPLASALEHLARETPSVDRLLAKLRQGFYER